jgi:hypothetical protein
MPATCLQTLRSHSAHARFLAACSEQPVGYIPRQSIPSPYAYSPVHPVYACMGKNVFIVETSHRKFQVFEVPTTEVVTDVDTAEETYMARLKK